MTTTHQNLLIQFAVLSPEDLQDVKEEPVDENDNEDTNCALKQEHTDEYEKEDTSYSVNQESVDECKTEDPCVTLPVSSLMFS